MNHKGYQQNNEQKNISFVIISIDCQQNMIQHVWNKRVIVMVEMDPKDIADQSPPLPLLLQIPWNHYIGFYYDQIAAFFSSYTVYPWNKGQFHLTMKSQQIMLNVTDIVGHLVTLFKEGIDKPIQIVCHFRSKMTFPVIQIKKYFKYNLKASTAIRNLKFGASMLTLQMSIDNVDKLFQNFKQNNLNSYMGSKDFESGNLGFSFITSKTDRVPVKIIAKNFIIERGVDKDFTLSEFLASVFEVEEFTFDQQKTENKQEVKERTQSQRKTDTGEVDSITVSELQDLRPSKETQKQHHIQQGIKFNYLFQKYQFSMHGIRLSRGAYPLEFFQRYCHPDGFLYIFFEENN